MEKASIGLSQNQEPGTLSGSLFHVVMVTQHWSHYLLVAGCVSRWLDQKPSSRNLDLTFDM